MLLKAFGNLVWSVDGCNLISSCQMSALWVVRKIECSPQLIVKPKLALKDFSSP